MAKELSVTLSMEWQCEQLAWANAFPARTFGSALHRVPKRKTFTVITTDDAILTFIWGILIAINCSESARETNVLGSTSKHPIRSVTLQTQKTQRIRQRVLACDLRQAMK